MREIRGCGTALITPFDDDFEIDWDSFGKLVSRQLDAGIDFLVPLGTTGETPCLEEYEKEKLLATVTEINGGKVPVVAGAGSNSTKKVLNNISSLSRHNPDAFLVVVPYYNKPTQEGIFLHFKAISESTSTPLILYNIPGRTGVNMTVETTLRLAELKNIIAVKEASGNYEQISETIRLAPDGFSVLSGNDDMTFPLMCSGGKGVISVASNVAPSPIVKMTGLLSEGRTEEAAVLHHRLMPLFKACFVESNPGPVKSAMALKGLIRNRLRLPLTSSTVQTNRLMESILEDIADL
ncbi:MAG: 4-hydroxy-tetrahydrodipicolinate synthase [Bacteroidales bacterium]|jgi:4-hydroxy-tetrahydrodipicolinate synthase|nr:4-hydroxy-tetrahydrodipicolinate synthase [Bacteroidales bacterium]